MLFCFMCDLLVQCCANYLSFLYSFFFFISESATLPWKDALCDVFRNGYKLAVCVSVSCRVTLLIILTEMFGRMLCCMDLLFCHWPVALVFLLLSSWINEV